jgi:hypothetical protein
MKKPKGKIAKGAYSNRHTFRFKVENGEVIEAPAVVIPGKRNVELTLTADHIKKSVKLGGQGNTQKCAMAVCSKEHRDSFGHDFMYVDWLDSKAYFVTETKNGLPSKCISYSHHDNVAPLFDTKIGLKKLLKEIEENGPKIIKLYPPVIYPSTFSAAKKARRGSIVDGSRSKTIRAKGAALRFARLQLGAAPQEAVA